MTQDPKVHANAMRPLKVGVLGAGYFAQFHYDAWARLAPDVQLVALADFDLAKAKAVARTYGEPIVYGNVRDMLDSVELDVLDIAAPPPAHRDAITAAAERGVDVICQKPYCTSLAEAEAVTAAAEAAGVRVIVHENFRFQPWHMEVGKRLKAGLIGELYQLSFRLRPGDGQGPDAYLSRQPYFQKMPRFLIRETAIHLIDTFRSFAGEVRSVYADLRRLNPVIAGEDAGVVLLTFESGVRAVVDGNRLVDHAAENHRLTIGEMLVEGSTGVIRLDGDGRIFHRVKGAREEHAINYDWEKRGFAGDSVFLTQKAAIDGLLGRQPIVNSARDYLVNLRIEEAVYQSAAEGRRIDITTGGGA
ncbi:MAG: Gfo/Idh/MocA family protein [Hyphomicrobiaceae bacterium]